MPVRRIPKKSGSVTGLLPTDKRPELVSGPDGRKVLSRMAAYESTLERDLFVCLEFDAAVATYEEQPLCIAYEDAGRRRTYTPDVLVTFRTGRVPLLVEVKPYGKLRRELAACRAWARAGRAEAMRRGWGFRILTEREIRSPFLTNATFLLPYRQRDRNEAVEHEVLRAFVDVADPTPARLAAHVGSGPDQDVAAVIPSVWALLAAGSLVADLRAPLTAHTPLTTAGPDGAPHRSIPWLTRRWSADPPVGGRPR